MFGTSGPPSGSQREVRLPDRDGRAAALRRSRDPHAGFIHASFFVSTAVKMMWIPTLIMNIAFMAWAGYALFVDKEAKNKVFWFKVPRLYEKGPADWLCWATAAVYCFFGITLYINGTLFWGPDSPFCYFTIESPTSLWAGRALGGSMLALFLLPYYSSLPYEKLSKLILFWHTTSLPLFLSPPSASTSPARATRRCCRSTCGTPKSRSPSRSSSSLRMFARLSRDKTGTELF